MYATAGNATVYYMYATAGNATVYYMYATAGNATVYYMYATAGNAVADQSGGGLPPLTRAAQKSCDVLFD